MRTQWVTYVYGYPRNKTSHYKKLWRGGNLSINRIILGPYRDRENNVLFFRLMFSWSPNRRINCVSSSDRSHVFRIYWFFFFKYIPTWRIVMCHVHVLYENKLFSLNSFESTNFQLIDLTGETCVQRQKSREYRVQNVVRRWINETAFQFPPLLFNNASRKGGKNDIGQTEADK